MPWAGMVLNLISKLGIAWGEIGLADIEAWNLLYYKKL